MEKKNSLKCHPLLGFAYQRVPFSFLSCVLVFIFYLSLCYSGNTIHSFSQLIVSKSSNYVSDENPKHLNCFNANFSSRVDEYAAICSVVRLQNVNELCDLREWVFHHSFYFKLKTYIFDHESSPSIRNLLADFIEKGFVEVIDFQWPRSNIPQFEAYRRCLRMLQNKHKFVGFIDWDEFLWLGPKWQGKKLKSFLQQFEDDGALGVAWLVHGSSHHLHTPREGVRKSFIYCTGDEDKVHRVHVKSFVRPELVTTVYTPHNFGLKEGYRTVDEQHRDMENSPWQKNYSVNYIRLHHYVLKSRDQFAMKIKRGSGDGGSKDWDFFDAINKMSTVPCLELAELKL